MQSNYSGGYNKNFNNQGGNSQVNDDRKKKLDEFMASFLEKENNVIKNVTLFSDTAEKVANLLKGSTSFKPELSTNQVRKFYDEFVHYADIVGDDKEKLTKYMPAINMIYAKVTYARVKGNVSELFVNFIKKLLEEITRTKDLANAKLFFESVYAFLDLKNNK